MNATVYRLGRATLIFVLLALLAHSTTTAAQTTSRPATESVKTMQTTRIQAQVTSASATTGSGCYVYPHTFHQDAIEYVAGPGGHPAIVPLPNPYASIAEIEANYQSSIFIVRRDPEVGNFLFLRWNGADASGGTSTDLLADFTGAGTLGYTFIESREPRNSSLEPGDWVRGFSGNATVIDPALTELRNTNTIMLLPLFGNRVGNGNNMEYQVTRVVAVRLLGWDFVNADKHFRYALVKRDAVQSCFRHTSRNTVGQTTLFTHTLPLTTGFTFNWTFGDGTTSTGLNTSHAYQTPGTYTVVLTTTTAQGFPTSGVGSVIIDAAPTVDFTTSSPDELGHTTSFISAITSSSGPVTPTWDFGDGTSITGVANPTHIYQALGTYTATLRVVDRNGFVVSRSYSVTVTADLGAGCYVYPITFHQDFLEYVPGPGGHPAPTPLPDPNVAWQQIEAMYPSSVFTIRRDPESGNFLFLRWDGPNSSGGTYYYQDFSSGGSLGYYFAESRDPRNYLLELGDWAGGTGGNATTLDPLLTALRDSNTIMILPLYNNRVGTGPNMEYEIGKFAAVRLVGWDFVGGDKHYKFALARSNASYSCFRSSNPDQIGQTTRFTNTMPLTTGLTFNWNFGDGSTGSGLNPTHVYAAGGVYTVTLTTTDSAGFVTRAIDTVLITNTSSAAFSHSGTTLGQPTQFTSTATGVGPLSYDWDFGDASAHATTANPSHTYAAAGSYLVRLVVTDSNGFSASQERSITITLEGRKIYLPLLVKN